MKRAVNGILLLDKPLGLSSNKALQQVRQLFGATKGGHTGNLDPLATGLLPLCFGHATKVCGYLLDADKSYEVVCHFGERTSTGDLEGEITEVGPAEASRLARLPEILERFTGDIEQIPPMYSALKHEGQRLYRLARKGLEVERPARRVRIHDLQLLSQHEKKATLRVRCSKGTYVRTLVEDLAGALGTVAHVQRLHRMELGPFSMEQNCHDMAALQAIVAEGGTAALDAILLPLDVALQHYPALAVNEGLAYYLRQGNPVFVPCAPEAGTIIRLYDPDHRFLGMGEILDDGRCALRRLMQG